MEQSGMRIILLVAFVTSSVLLLLGWKNKNNLRTKSLFGLALAFFLGMGQQSNDLWAVKKQQSPDFQQEFQGRVRWNKIKVLWKKLDAVEPNESGFYISALDWKEIEELKKEAGELFGYEQFHLKNKTTNINVSLYEKVLYSLIIDRIDNFGIPPYMMSRMMPPPTLTYRHALVGKMELAIDVLLKLRSEKKISAKEFQNAWDRISDNISVYALMNTISINWGDYNYLTSAVEKTMVPDNTMPFDSVIVIWTEGLKKSYQKSMKYYEDELKKEKDPKKNKDLKEYRQLLKNSFERVNKELELLKGKEQHFTAMLKELVD